MKLLLLISLAALLVLLEGAKVPKPFPEQSRLFTVDLYKQIQKIKIGNFVISPLSPQIILGLIHNGAIGATAKQLSHSLHLPESNKDILHIFQEYLPHFNVSGEYILKNHNNIFLQTGYVPKDPFHDVAVNVFGANIRNFDFEKSKQIVAEINQHISDLTENQIQHLVKEQDLIIEPPVWLLSTLHFQGAWEKPFEKRFTFERNFYLDKCKRTTVHMLQQRNEFKYYESAELNAKFLELPYVGGHVTLTIILPNDVEGMCFLEERLGEVLVTPEYKEHVVEVSLPKFKIQTSTRLRPILRKLRIINAFEDYADFIHFLNKPSKISRIVQGSYIEIDEEGTFAFNLTPETQKRYGDSQVHKAVEFDANHPFLYYIKVHDVIAYIGRYTGK